MIKLILVASGCLNMTVKLVKSQMISMDVSSRPRPPPQDFTDHSDILYGLGAAPSPDKRFEMLVNNV